MLKLTDEAYQFLLIEVKDGRNCHFWFDNWMGKGRLIDITGAVGTTYLGLLRPAKVSNAATEEGWIIRGRRSRRYHDLYESIMVIDPPKADNGANVVLWKHGDDDYKASFSAARTWEQVRSKRNKAAWRKVVWIPQGVPRYAFITWLAVKNRLFTGDRMRQWGLVQGCELCGERDEMRDHLFFACPFSYTVWESLARNLVGSGINPDWQWTLQRLQRMRVKGMDSCLAKLLFQTTLYHIWRERNARRHQTPRVSTDCLQGFIYKAMKNRICSLKYRPLHKLEGLLKRWFEVTA